MSNRKKGKREKKNERKARGSMVILTHLHVVPIIGADPTTMRANRRFFRG